MDRDNPVVETTVQPKFGGNFGSRKQFVIQMREPWKPPEDVVELPAPPAVPPSPSTLNLFTTLLPPIIMLLAMLTYAQIAKSKNSSVDLTFLFIMPIVGMAFPIANMVNYFFQRRTYRMAMEAREQKYRTILNQQRERLNEIAQQQRTLMDREYALLPRVIDIALKSAKRHRLWWRRPGDNDFLWLRMGTGMSAPTFKVTLPRLNDQNDPLTKLADDVINSYQEIADLPIILDLPRVGSVTIVSKSGEQGYAVARRLVLDILIHHSPQEVQVAVLADSEEAQKRWEWLKWAPHTRSINQGENLRRLAFSSNAIDRYLEWLTNEYQSRKNPDTTVRKKEEAPPAIVALLDDNGEIRQSSDAKLLASHGHEVGIYLIFVGGRNWPRECRARIDVTEGDVHYVESWAGDERGKRLQGRTEFASLLDCERASRSLANLEISSSKGSSNLPESVRLTEVLDTSTPSLESIKLGWQRVRDDDELLQFPFGLRGGRKGVEPVVLNLLPAEKGGISAYHTILVGTTGSGKSEFMKSLVLSAAYKYAPRLLNFFFMDFKGGAAFNVLKDLPHVVGVVTNLGPDLVERGLSAIESEIERRQRVFSQAGVQSIWAYNEKFPDASIPHLVMLLDEFARGLDDFPRLPAMLDRLVRQGRSLGMYMLLANQDVNPAVDRLLNNVGWHIALKVARQEEMHVIDRSLPKAERTGQGYLHSMDGDLYEFQAAYAGVTFLDQKEETQSTFKIYTVGADGKWQLLHTSAQISSKAEQKQQQPAEQDLIVSLIKEATSDTDHARPMYLDPLPDTIQLHDILAESALKSIFGRQGWNEDLFNGSRLIAPVGALDFPQRCIQENLEIDFEDQDGHLWIVGAPSSGKAMTLTSIMLSLALTHPPDKLQFYILEYGAGTLNAFEQLPHTGAVLRLTEEERLVRLIRFLSEEMDKRSSGHLQNGEQQGWPQIFLVINNFSELRKNYSDQAEQIQRFVRDGKSAGIHLIITTNRGADLPRVVASNISKRIALQMASDEYMDVLGVKVMPLSARSEGRGYFWSSEMGAAECQIARPILDEELTDDWRQLIKEMDRSWHGERPQSIDVLKTCIPLVDLWPGIPHSTADLLPVPVGIGYDNLNILAPNLLNEIPQWLVLGPHRSGRSNFLASVASAALRQNPGGWRIKYFAFRRSPLDWLQEGQLMDVFDSTQSAVDACNQIGEQPDAGGGNKRTLLLMDDIGAAFSQGKETLAQALNALALRLPSRNDVFLIAASTLDEVRLLMTSNLFIRFLHDCKTGVCLSKDPSDLDWLGIQMIMQPYRKMDFPPGRGFWVSGGKARLVQTPKVGECPPTVDDSLK